MHHVVRLVAALASVWFGWLAAPAPAEACSCPLPPPRVQPAGAGAPLNAVPTVSGISFAAADLSLVEVASGMTVAGAGFVVINSTGGFTPILGFRPAALLAPNTVHELRVGLDVLGQFATGEAIDDTPPGAPTLGPVAARVLLQERFDCTNSCVSGRTELEAAVTTVADAARTLVAMRRPGEAEPFALVPWAPEDSPGWDGMSFGRLYCSPRPAQLEPYEEVCVSAVVWDVAGHVTSSAEQCVTAEGCSAALDAECFPQIVECWASPPPEDGGCGSCALGARRDVPGRGGAAAGVLASLAAALLIVVRRRCC